jgi:hypothetical protein
MAAIIIVLLAVCLAAAVLFTVVYVRREGVREPGAWGNPPSSTESYRVTFGEKTTTDGVTIRLTPAVSTDGRLVYQVLGPQGASLGTFGYVPWQDQNPLFQQLPGGDLILGTHSLYRKSNQSIQSLGAGSGLGYVSDYSVNGSELALAGKTGSQQDTRVYIDARDLSGGSWTQVDSFTYPDYMSEKQVYLCWAGGKLYYDCWQDDMPVIRVYDPGSKQSSLFKENALDPLVSPNGRYLVMFASDAPGEQGTGAGMGLELVDLGSGQVTGLQGSSNRLFWSGSYVITWDGLSLQLHVYDLSDGARVADLPVAGPVSDLSVSPASSGHPDIVNGFQYQFVNRRITRQPFQEALSAE